MNFDLTVKECSDAWLKAGCDLGINVIAPCKKKDGSVQRIFAAYLPEFGSLNGCYLYPVFSLAQNEDWRGVLAWAEANKSYVSFIQFDEYRAYDRERFIEALSDWGYFGPKLQCPTWLKNQQL